MPQSGLNSAEPPMLPLKQIQSYCQSVLHNVYLVLQIWIIVGSLFDLYYVGVQKSEKFLLSTTVAMVAIVDTRLIAW